MTRCLNARHIKAWIRGDYLVSLRKSVPKLFESICFHDDGLVVPSVFSVLALSAANLLLLSSIIFLALGMGFYFGSIWLSDLDESALPHGNAIVFGTYLFCLGICTVVFGLFSAGNAGNEENQNLDDRTAWQGFQEQLSLREELRQAAKLRRALGSIDTRIADLMTAQT